MSDLPNGTHEDIPEEYLGDFNRLAKTVETRCALLGETPTLIEIETQIALRSSIQKIASLRRELTALRAVIGRALLNEGWPEGIEYRDWVMQASIEDIAQLHAGLIRTASDFVEIGKPLSQRFIADLMELNYPGTDEETWRALAGISAERSARKTRDKKNMTVITDREFMELELQLSDHDHQNALRSLVKGRVDGKSLLRIFMRTIRLTGMRPIEVFTCQIFTGDQSRIYDEELISDIRKDPYKAVASGLMKNLDDLDPREWGGFSEMITSIEQMTGAPTILLVKSAKTSNANPTVYRPFRAMIMDDIPKDDMEVLCLAAHLHLFDLGDKRKANLITSMTKSLTAAAKLALPKREDRMNLYSFRHDFATRAKRVMHLWEVAVIMGHTAKSSTYHYGKRRSSKGGKSGSSGWMPVADATHAEMLRLEWQIPIDQDVSAEVSQKVQRATAAFNNVRRDDPETRLG